MSAGALRIFEWIAGYFGIDCGIRLAWVQSSIFFCQFVFCQYFILNIIRIKIIRDNTLKVSVVRY